MANTCKIINLKMWVKLNMIYQLSKQQTLSIIIFIASKDLGKWVLSYAVYGSINNRTFIWEQVAILSKCLKIVVVFDPTITLVEVYP